VGPESERPSRVTAFGYNKLCLRNDGRSPERRTLCRSGERFDRKNKRHDQKYNNDTQ
jgi:hypothetical protein